MRGINTSKLAALFALVFAFAAYGDTATTGGARVIENPTQDGNLVMRINDGGTKKDALSITGSTGSMAYGPSGTTNVTHTFYGTQVSIKSSSSSEAAILRFYLDTAHSGSLRASSGADVTGVAAGDMVFIGTNKPLHFSMNDGTSNQGNISTTGVWSLGPASGSFSGNKIRGVSDGTAATAGYVGEVIEATITSTAGSTTKNTYTSVTNSSLALTAGEWAVFASIGAYFRGVVGIDTNNYPAYQSVSIVDSGETETIASSTITGPSASHASVNFYHYMQHNIVARQTLSSNKTIKLRFSWGSDNGTPTVTGHGIGNSTKFYAVRIR